MNHLERALDGQNQIWKYFILFLIAFAGANTIGSLPLLGVVMYKVMKSDGAIQINPDNLMDLSVYGIDSNTGLILMILPFIAGLFTVILLLKPFHKRNYKEVINGTLSIRWGRFFTGALVWGVLMGGYLLIDYWMNPDNFVVHFEPATLIPLVVIALLLIPFQTTFEEVMFRGYLAQGIGAATRSRWFVVLIPGVLFGLMHFANPEVVEFGFWMVMPQYIFFGLTFGLISVLDDGIESAMGVHAANNIFAAVFITHKSSALQTAAIFEQQTINPGKETIALVVASVLLVTVLGAIYKWKPSIINRRIEQTA
jgi:uncharacterized protein